ncbi:beta-eliminating lyase-related protein [Streptomyces yatensis]|uniref:Aromatic amino acid beta-eliminating lyase/threonine aldolase domain-containing protein n=1 Tax=Streptomyces yatensis TaxID=155177 RepID=A0ABN2IYQ1_9ACTN
MSTTIATTPAGRSFISDNMAGASPEIVQAVADAAAGQVLPYGNDPFTDSARRRLSEIFERDVDVFMVSTGSAANGLSLAALTSPWGSVRSAATHAEGRAVGGAVWTIAELPVGFEGEVRGTA